LEASIIFIAIFFSIVYGLLTDDGTCANGIAIIGNETQILNQSAADYIRNLTTDNRLLAEMVCHTMLNETTTKQ
jgi:hypothetical protein